MRSAVEFCVFGIVLFVALVAAFHLALALGFGEPVWEPLATMASAIGVMGLLGLERTDAEMERCAQRPPYTRRSPSNQGESRPGSAAPERSSLMGTMPEV